MRAIVCVDLNNGTMFNHRRQSKDRILQALILSSMAGKPIYMSPYSAKQFSEKQQVGIVCSDDPFTDAGPAGVVFAETGNLKDYEAELDTIILFRWDRLYPADTFLDIQLPGEGWTLTDTMVFAGHSHEKITMEVYEK